MWVFDNAENKSNHSAYWYDMIAEKLTKAEYEVSPDYPMDKHMLVRMQGAIPISFDFTSREGIILS